MWNIRYKGRTRAIGIAAVFCVLACAAHPVHAQQNTSSLAETFSVAQGEEPAEAGALVSFMPNKPKTVQLATSTTASRLIGVIATSPIITLASGSENAKVALSGTTQALVSDINGTIQVGDKITASPIAGVGMRATADTQVVGTALASAPARNAKTRSIPDSRGRTHTVHIQSILLQVGAAYYQAPGSNILPPFVQRAANAIAGRNVSLTRVLVCSMLLLTSLIGITVLVYVATRSAMISLGRNPLAAHDIRKSLYQVITVAASVAALTLVAAYLILAV
jgi:hypothetical protein